MRPFYPDAHFFKLPQSVQCHAREGGKLDGGRGAGLSALSFKQQHLLPGDIISKSQGRRMWLTLIH